MTRKRDIERPYRPELVSAETLAYLLDCSRSTIDDYVDKGLLPKPVDIGMLKRWWWGDVAAFIRSKNGLANTPDDSPPSEEDDPILRRMRRGAPSHA